MALVGRVGLKRQSAASGSFADLSDYLRREGEHADKEAPLHTFAGNVSSLENAVAEMQATAGMGHVTTDPIAHHILSWEDMERPTDEQAEEAARIYLRELGLDEHQYVAALQNDGKGGLWHLHIMVNRVHPVTHRAWDTYKDFERAYAAGRVVEVEQGWLDRAYTYGKGPEAGLSRGARDAAYYDRQRAFQHRVRDDIAPAVRANLAGPMPTWTQMHATLREHGMTYVEAQSGAYLRGTMPGEGAGLKAMIGLSHKDLVDRLGAYEPDRRGQRPFDERARSTMLDVLALRDAGGKTWTDVHAAFERRGLDYEKHGGGARVRCLDTAAHTSAGKLDRKLRLSEMEKAFGPFEGSADVRAREQAADAIRRAENALRGERILADPSPIVERLTAHDATFTLSKLRKAVNDLVADPEQRNAIVEKITDSCVVLEAEKGHRRFTTVDVLAEEKEMIGALEAIASERRDVVSDPKALAAMQSAVDAARTKHVEKQRALAATGHGGDAAARAQAEFEAVEAESNYELAQQTRDAYTHATSDAQLVMVTGVPGAGKTYLIDKVADAYRAAGYRVRGTAVSWQACNELNSATDFSSRSLRKEIFEWENNRDRLTPRDVIIYDEVSMGGTPSGRALLAEARRAGARVVMTGDDKQLPAVERGDLMRAAKAAIEKHGGHVYDMQTTRRQVLDRTDPFNEPDWQRTAIQQMRAGDVRAGLDAFHKRGRIKIVGTDEERRRCAVDDWKAAVAAGEIGARGQAYRNEDVNRSNADAHQAMRDLGLLKGPDHTIRTGFGERTLAVGERVVVRQRLVHTDDHGDGEKPKKTVWTNGDMARVVRIEGTVLHLRRERDGARIAMNTADMTKFGEATNRVDLAYFGTSHRVQGITTDTMRAEAGRADNAPSMLVGMSRGRGMQRVYVSQESTGGKTAAETYERFVRVASREVRKELSTDFRVLGLGAEVKRGLERERVAVATNDRTQRPSASPDRSRTHGPEI